MRSWALTGTPIENHEEELASILEFVDHGPGGQSRRYQPGPELFRRHRQLQLRRKKSDVLEDLPEKQVTLLPIELHAAQRASYDKAEQEGVVYLRSLGRNITIQHVLELITRLKADMQRRPRERRVQQAGRHQRKVGAPGWPGAQGSGLFSIHQ